MQLKLTAGEPGSRAFVAGYNSQLSLDGQDVSQWVSSVTVHAAAEGPIEATVTFFLTEQDIDVPAVIKPLLDEARESGTLGGGSVRRKSPLALASSKLPAGGGLGSAGYNVWLGSVAYKAHQASSGGVNLLTGDMLPGFDELPAKMQTAWIAVARTVQDTVLSHLRYAIEEL